MTRRLGVQNARDDREKGGVRETRTEDELLERCEYVDTPGHLDLVDLKLEPLSERSFGRHGDGGCRFVWVVES